MCNQNIGQEKDCSLLAPLLNTAPGTEYGDEARKWQGIPALERARNGRLFVAFYSGGTDEGPDNYVLLVKSDDDGKNWSEPILVIDPPGMVRAFDPCMWMDPIGRLWLFWAQSYTFFDGRVGVWASTCLNPEAKELAWSEPRRIANGIMMNKPTVLSTGEWLLPCAIWKCVNSDLNSLKEEQFSNIYISRDLGNSFELHGKADVQDRWYDEHMVVERTDGSLWMLVRAKYGINESLSYDKGKTWSTGRKTTLGGPNSRFFIRRLNSGSLLLVNYCCFDDENNPTCEVAGNPELPSSEQLALRKNLTAMISDDDGATWKGFLLLDERGSVSYPDGVESEDGLIYIVYDRDRYGDKEILMAVFTEKDVLAGRCVTEKARLKVLVNKAGGG